MDNNNEKKPVIEVIKHGDNLDDPKAKKLEENMIKLTEYAQELFGIDDNSPAVLLLAMYEERKAAVSISAGNCDACFVEAAMQYLTMDSNIRHQSGRTIIESLRMREAQGVFSDDSIEINENETKH